MNDTTATTGASTLTVGELANMFGLTVRALHHWESIGLLTPERSESGHRRYGQVEVDRVLRVCVLRELGMSLEEIRTALDEADGLDARSFLEREDDRLAGQLAELERQRGLLRTMLAVLGIDSGARALADALSGLSRRVATLTPDQFARIEAINAELSELDAARMEERGLAILAELRGLHQAGAQPDDPKTLDAVARNRELLLEMVGGDRELALALERMSLEPEFAVGLVGELADDERAWLTDAVAHLRD